MCSCPEGLTGDPFSYCRPIPADPPKPPQPPSNPCYPDPCGHNAQCREANSIGICACLPEYQGDPITGCRPECVSPAECPSDKTCVNRKCVDPCPGVCGQNAQCRAINHNPVCDCLPGFVGDPYRRCTLEIVTQPVNTDPCSPNQCGPNSICRVIGNKAACSCKQGYKGSPPNCRPECVTNAECSADKACYGQKCVDPCPGQCGTNANCLVQNHNPVCKCETGYTGDPYRFCSPIPQSKLIFACPDVLLSSGIRLFAVTIIFSHAHSSTITSFCCSHTKTTDTTEPMLPWKMWLERPMPRTQRHRSVQLSARALRQPL